MQSLSRALSSLRGACSSSGRSIATRSMSQSAEGAARYQAFYLHLVHLCIVLTISRNLHILRLNAEATISLEGAKSTLHRLLSSADRPLTSAEVWSIAESEGLKSKRFMKQMLSQMRQRGHIRTVPLGAGKKHKSFGYFLPGTAAEEVHAASKGLKV